MTEQKLVVESGSKVYISKVVNIQGSRPFSVPYEIVVDFKDVPDEYHQAVLDFFKFL